MKKKRKAHPAHTFLKISIVFGVLLLWKFQSNVSEGVLSVAVLLEKSFELFGEA